MKKKMEKKRNGKSTDKKAMEMAVSTIILIVLGVLILIALLLIFTGQAEYFADFLKTITGKSNVDDVARACNQFALSKSYYDYCCENIKVRMQGEEIELSCDELRQVDIVEIDELDCNVAKCPKINS